MNKKVKKGIEYGLALASFYPIGRVAKYGLAVSRAVAKSNAAKSVANKVVKKIGGINVRATRFKVEGQKAAGISFRGLKTQSKRRRR